MEISVSRTDRKTVGQRGFTLIEVMISITVLAVGMLAMAALMARINTTTDKSRYMSTASLLASEKLEQLSHYPKQDPRIVVTGATSAGSLTTDASSDSVDYYDEVLVSAGDGLIAETTVSKDDTGNTQYTTITQTPNGEVKPPTQSATAPSFQGVVAFKRRWLIEKDTPVVGVCRLTVSVLLENASTASAVQFQMSMARQYATE
jgi:type IV pilus modification protein PilV